MTPAMPVVAGTADDMIARLGLRPHPEGGHYAETYRAPGEGHGRGACTVIHYLLRQGERSHWHRVDAVEIWAWHGGDGLRLSIAETGPDGRTEPVAHILLGGPDQPGHTPHAVVPAHAWQAAEPVGDWALVSCVVAPAFQFSGFEMAPAGWSPV